jgi:hypothetical protein|tara:strand:- start:619 stop:1041 length:423 start_codon:yes stop_codon:yes gene_type:complete
MALQGDITWTTVKYSSTEFEDQVITYPDEMNENDPNYDKAGTSETVQVEKQIITIKDYDDVYLWVKQIDVIYNYNGENKNEGIHYHIAAYNSKEERNEDQENFLFHYVRELHNVNKDANLWQQCYNDLKSDETFSNLTDI